MSSKIAFGMTLFNFVKVKKKKIHFCFSVVFSRPTEAWAYPSPDGRVRQRLGRAAAGCWAASKPELLPPYAGP